MAERQGFEPWRRLPAYTLSRRAPSTTRPPLRWKRCYTKPEQMRKREALDVRDSILLGVGWPQPCVVPATHPVAETHHSDPAGTLPSAFLRQGTQQICDLFRVAQIDVALRERNLDLTFGEAF